MLDENTIIKLNVGGRLFETYYKTLKPSGYLGKLLETADSLDEYEEVFVNRHGELFEHVLAFLRNSSVVGDYSESQLLELKEEAVYLQIEEMAQVIEKRLYDMSLAMATREYSLVDLNGLEKLSCIQESSADTHEYVHSLADKYDIITLVRHTDQHRNIQSRILLAKK